MVRYFLMSSTSVGNEVVVPDPHRLKDGGEVVVGLRMGKTMALKKMRIGLQPSIMAASSISMGTLFMRAGEHEHGETGTEAQIDDADVPGGVQIEGVGGLGQGEHDL